MSDQFPPNQYPPGQYPQNQYPQGQYPTGPSAVAENPEGTKALIVSLLGLFCCAPLAIWSLVMAKSARSQGYDDGKTTAAFVISIVALVLWAVALVLNLTVFSTSFTFG